MGENSAIEWCHHTYQPWIGCAEAKFPDGRQHPACDHCYAREGFGKRFGVKWGPVAEGGTRRPMSEDNWAKPARWARVAAKAGERRRVFCASLADVLDEEAPVEAQQRLWQQIRETANLCRMCGWSVAEPARRTPFRVTGCWCLGDRFLPGGGGFPGLDWLLLTKRPERWEVIPEDVRPLAWLGTSISDQATADEWVPRLFTAKDFRLRFLSVEPLIGPVDISPFLTAWAVMGKERWEPAGHIDWVIVGGESGSKARPCHVEWIRSVVEQCRAASVPCFVKQLGANPRGRGATTQGGPPGAWILHDKKKGGDPSEWPADLRVRQFPEVRP